MSERAETLLLQWQSWFTGPKLRPPRGTLIDALISHFSAETDKEASWLAKFKEVLAAQPDDNEPSYGESVKIKKDVHKKLVDLAQDVMKVTVQKFLSALVRFYSDKSRTDLLRDILRHRVVKLQYKDKPDCIAIDIPLSLIPKFVDGIPQAVLEEAIKKMAANLRLKERKAATELLIKTKKEVMDDAASAIEDFQFVVLEIDPEFKNLLKKLISDEMKFSSHVAAYLVKVISNCK